MRLALAQAPGDLAGFDARLNWLAAALPKVAAQGADLVLLPELFACGYNIGAGLKKAAEPQDGPMFQAISAFAKTHQVAIHFGYSERAGAAIYNAAQCVGADGARLTHQRKLAIPPGFERDVFAPGRGCALFELAGLNVATLICYDAEFSETVRHVAGLGADLVLVPTALGAQWGWVGQTMIPTRAYENGVYLAYANSAGVENGLEYLGASVIAAPDGVEVARAGRGPDIIYGDLTKDRVISAQARLPYLRDRADLALD